MMEKEEMNKTKEINAQEQADCASCPVHHAANLKKLGVDMESWDFVVALAGNPNTGKSTVFNALTGLRQHTGNWPGKTVTRAEGGFDYADSRYKMVDLPGTYSLLATSLDEEIARDFILFGQPDVTVVVVDASRLERNLNLVLQVLEITNRVVICLNLMDEVERHHMEVDHRRLALAAIHEVAAGDVQVKPYHVKYNHPRLDRAVSQLVEQIKEAFPQVPNARWVALRLLDGDQRIIQAVESGELGELAYTIEDTDGVGVTNITQKSGFSQ